MIRYDCRYFRTSRPCVFNKQEGAECPTCARYAPFRERVLFIKLDAIGDVLRSASLLPAVIARHERPFVAWLTRAESAELVAMIEGVDEVITLNTDGLARIAAGGWSAVYSLSNDLTSAALANAAAGKAVRPVGFFLRDGVIAPSNKAAETWLEMAAFDRLKRANTQTYQQRMMAILGSDFEVRPPVLRVPPALLAKAKARVAALFPAPGRPRIAVNVGSGARWPKKMLGAEQIAAVLAALRGRADADILLVGGGAEAGKTEAILAAMAGDPHIASALTPHSIPEFVATLMQANALLCGDTLALHIASAIELPTLAVFGPTSHAEIGDFDGLIEKAWTPALDCLGCYGDCAKTPNCMSLLDPAQLAERLLARLPA
ncbi:MAG TPA: glycosyltransferase family 9 protein [Acetobacteraceae bacterium]|nr:glycosyltransferase family 9 protein [Acetobacteraceae bacterium]